MRRVELAVPAPAGLGIPVLGVQAASVVELDLRLEAVVEGVLVSGTATAQVSGECVRCLDPLQQELVADLQELYAYPYVEREPDDEADVLRLDGDYLDLEPVLRDAVVLELPLAPVCQEDCPGLCVQCGARLADDPDHAHELTDTRWAALQALAGPQDRPTDSPSTDRRSTEKQEI